MLAILANLTFQLLYDVVADGVVDVANPQYRRSRTDNFLAVYGPFASVKKSPWQNA
jgi:hypothetical protein